LKIALACQSILLEKSLEVFLKNHIAPYKQCDFVISDRNIEINKPLFNIGIEKADLIMPFSRSTLMLKLENFYDNLYKNTSTDKSQNNEIKNQELEKKITKLTDTFRDDLLNVIKEYYDN